MNSVCMQSEISPVPAENGQMRNLLGDYLVYGWYLPVILAKWTISHMRHPCLLILESIGEGGSQEATSVFVLKFLSKRMKTNKTHFLTFLVNRCWELLTLLLDGLDTERDKEMVLENACKATVQTWECLALVGGSWEGDGKKQQRSTAI